MRWCVDAKSMERIEMHGDLEGWLIGELEFLPPVPETVSKLEDDMSNPASSAASMANIIERDTPLTADLLKLVNSSFLYVKNEVTSVAQVVALLGRRRVKDYSIAVSLRRSFEIDLSPYGLDPDDFMLLATKRAMLAVEIADKFYGPAFKEKIFLPALLQDIGRILIAKRILQDEKTEIFLRIAKDQGFRNAEKMFVGYVTEEVSSRMLHRWGISGYIPAVIYHSYRIPAAESEILPYAASLRLAEVGTGLMLGLTMEKNIVEEAEGLKIDSGKLLGLVESFSD